MATNPFPKKSSAVAFLLSSVEVEVVAEVVAELVVEVEEAATTEVVARTLGRTDRKDRNPQETSGSSRLNFRVGRSGRGYESDVHNNPKGLVASSTTRKPSCGEPLVVSHSVVFG